MAESRAAASETGALVRRVTTFTAACVLISNMIGTGIFGTTGFMAADLGRPGLILFLWLLGGAYALLGAFSYAELGASMPRAGGEYVYIREALGPVWGFLSGWTSLTIGFSAAIASNAHLFADHLRRSFPVLLVPADGGASWQGLVERGRVLELGMVWGLTAVHVAGVGAGGFLQRWLTIIKVGALLLLVALGLAVGQGDWGNLRVADAEIPFSLRVALTSFLFVTFSYSGWNAVGYIAGEMKRPQRSIPRAMIWGTISVGALYLALNVIYFYALPVQQLAADPIATVGHKSAEALFGAGIGRWFAALLTISILGAASAMVWAGPRVYYAMACDGVFPRFFAGTSARAEVPARSIVLQSVWISVLVVTGTFETLVLYASFVLIIFTALAIASVLVLRRTRPQLDRPYRAWAYPWSPLAYLLLSAAILWAALQIRPTESLWGVATVLAGLPFYYVWKRRHA